jgi:hypothetical protein
MSMEPTFVNIGKNTEILCFNDGYFYVRDEQKLRVVQRNFRLIITQNARCCRECPEVEGALKVLVNRKNWLITVARRLGLQAAPSGLRPARNREKGMVC